jgi:hypothetical protein
LFASSKTAAVTSADLTHGAAKVFVAKGCHHVAKMLSTMNWDISPLSRVATNGGDVQDFGSFKHHFPDRKTEEKTGTASRLTKRLSRRLIERAKPETPFH